MISEGVDIPRLRVGVFATTTTTELFFRQAVGRLVRWTRGLGAQRAYLFVPDDPRLRHHAAAIAEQRRHLLRRRDDDEGHLADERGEADAADEGFEQLSLFAAISSVAIGSPLVLAPADVASDEEDVDDDGEGVTLLELPALPGAAAVGGEPAVNMRERRVALRDANADVARDLARLSGMSHAQVNAELNRLVGLKRVSEATVDELALRVERGDRWRRRLIG
jgi:superfamily II DNA or RNA helicase